MNIRTFIYLCGILLGLLLGGCNAMPEPEEFSVSIKKVEAHFQESSVELVAELDGDPSAVLHCGFVYGKTINDMKTVPASLGASAEFSVALTGLEPITQYVYKAFISNGIHAHYSDIYSFFTSDHTPSDHPVSELQLSSYETYVEGKGEKMIGVTVTCDSAWEIIIPEDTDWVSLNDVAGNIAYLYVLPNMTTYERVCDVVFRTIDNKYSVTHKIVQSPLEWNILEIEVSHQSQIWVLQGKPGLEMWSYTSLPAWMSFGGGASIFSFSLYENNTTEARTAYFQVELYNPQEYNANSSDRYDIKLTQHSYLDIVSFADPMVKEMCVRLWDLNRDEELSFEEFAAVQRLEEGQFSYCAITSFDEFRFFNLNALQILPDYLFEGSSLVSASLPFSTIGYGTGKGAFKDCRALKTVDLGNRVVSDEAFMNCSSLKEMHAVIEGARAFMGCTSLETVYQRSFSVPEMAFKGCTSLRNVTLDFLYSRQSEIIGSEAFHGCSSLSEILLHRNVSSIGDRAFYGCTDLSAVYISSSIPPALGEDVFTGTGPDFRIRVPSSLVKVYQSNWPDLADIIEAE